MVKNVVVVNDFAYINGGAGKVAIMSAIALAEKGLNVLFFCGSSADKICEELRLSKVKIVTTNQDDITSGNKLKGICQGLYNKKATQELYNLLKTLDPRETVVHFHAWSKILSTSIFIATKKAKVPAIITGHDYGTVCPNGCFFDFREEKICTCKPNGMACIMKNCDKKSYLYKAFRIVRQILNRLYISHNNLHYIFISQFSRNVIKKSLAWPIQEQFVINPSEVERIAVSDVCNNEEYIFIGRVSQEKGIPTFCEAMKCKGNKGIVIGDGPVYEQLKRKYPMVRFVGWKNSDEIVEYALKARALIFPSIWYEAAPLTIPEVMGKFALPCVVSDLCAGQDYITDGFNGYVFKGGDVQSLIEKLDKLNKNLQTIQNNIINTFDGRMYSNSVHADNLIKEYNKILSK